MASKRTAIEGRGRPKLGTYRLETMLPHAALEELKRREQTVTISQTPKQPRRNLFSLDCSYARPST
jgi:hypothetical protein